MEVVKLATKVSLEIFRAFVTARDGFKTKDGKQVTDDSGKPVPENARGNFSVTFDGAQHSTLAEITSDGVAESDIVAAYDAQLNDSKLTAGSKAVKELAVPPTTPVNADSFAEWSAKAQEAFSSAADKVIRPEISSRAMKAAWQAQADSLKAKLDSGSANVEDKLALLDVLLKLQ